MADLRMLQLEIEKHLEQIEKILPKEYKLTLLARHTTMEKGKNADILLTLDDMDEAIEAIRRLKGEGS